MDIGCSQKQDGKKSVIFVYCLTFPDGKCYVGVSGKPKLRIRQHQQRSEVGTQPSLNDAWKKNGEPELSILAETTSREAAFLLEKHFIKALNTKVPYGHNMTDGGRGIVGRSEESFRESGRKLSEKYRTDPEFREKMRAAAIKAGPKVAEANRRFYATPEGRQCMRARTESDWLVKITASNQRPRTPKEKQAMKDAGKRNWQDPAYREKVNAAREARQAELRKTDPIWVNSRAKKMAAAMKEKWKDPAYREKMKTRKPPVLSLEKRLEIWEKRRASWTPEERAIRMAKGKSRYWKEKMLKALASQGKNESNL
jgi:predicted GIY-YIG superfamily endonuclease